MVVNTHQALHPRVDVATEPDRHTIRLQVDRDLLAGRHDQVASRILRRRPGVVGVVGDWSTILDDQLLTLADGAGVRRKHTLRLIHCHWLLWHILEAGVNWQLLNR